MCPNFEFNRVNNNYNTVTFCWKSGWSILKFLNIDNNDEIVKGTFNANNNNTSYNYVDYVNNVKDILTISKTELVER